MEYAGFLDWLWHRGETPCDVIDLSDAKISHDLEDDPSQPTDFRTNLAALAPNVIVHNRLWDAAKPLAMTERLRYHRLWQQLISENAPLRVIDGDRLVSAPISFFDSLLMSYVTDEWQKTVKVFTGVITSYWDDDICQTDDAFLAARMQALVDGGRVEIRGEAASDFTFGEVRLAKPRLVGSRFA
ncbi:MAG: hypothetical protein JWL86_1593 [Rhizobium sp.]|nr:hypothetical protein [Rhizobium sp.]